MKSLILSLCSLNFILQFTYSQTDFNLEISNIDATSIQLNWSPLSNIKSYQAYRDNSYIGYTISNSGYFNDYGLNPNQSYHYHIIAVDSNDIQYAFSDTISITTASSSTIRTNYNVLALAYFPSGINTDELISINSFLKHRISFFKLASFGNANLQLYKNEVVTIQSTLEPVGTLQGYTNLLNTPFTELDSNTIVDLIEKRVVDVIWWIVTKNQPAMNFGENNLIGNHNIGNKNTIGEKWISYKVGCSRTFFINCYTSEERCYDAYAHKIEGIMSSICDGYPDNWPRDKQYEVYTHNIADFNTTELKNLHLFERFRMADEWNGPAGQQYSSKGNGNCGTSHFPPNSPRYIDPYCSGYCYDGDYAYRFSVTWRRYIDSYSDDWLSYPNFTNISRKQNGYDFGAFNYYIENDFSYKSVMGTSPELHSSFSYSPTSYHQWWFNHIPHNAGVNNGKLNTWWPYIYDFNRFRGSIIDYPVDGFLDIPNSYQSKNDEFGTEDSLSSNWGYWHSNNGFSPFGKYGAISVVNFSEYPSNVKSGDIALKIYVENTETAESFDKGANQIFYPRYKNAKWDLSSITNIKFSIKLGYNNNLIIGTNPIIKLCTNGGNKIEYVPVKTGRYKNLFKDLSLQDENGWYNFTVPTCLSSNWEKNIIGYIDPSLNSSEKNAAKNQLEQDILSEVNYVEISVKSTRESFPLDSCTFYIDNLRFGNEPMNCLSFIDSKEINSNFKIYPNPTSGYITISFNELINGNVNVKLYDITNKLLSNTQFSNENQIKLDLSNRAPGIYFLTINAMHQTSQLKIIKR